MFTTQKAEEKRKLETGEGGGAKKQERVSYPYNRRGNHRTTMIQTAQTRGESSTERSTFSAHDM